MVARVANSSPLDVAGPAPPTAPHQAPPTLNTCPNCLYSLRGLRSDRCPECGKIVIDPFLHDPPGAEASLGWSIGLGILISAALTGPAATISALAAAFDPPSPRSILEFFAVSALTAAALTGAFLWIERRRTFARLGPASRLLLIATSALILAAIITLTKQH